jgi:hypothetical protein
MPTGLYFLFPVMSINLHVLDDSGGMIGLWLNCADSWNPNHTISGIQMVKWCNWNSDSWFLESNGKMVQLGFSLIIMLSYDTLTGMDRTKRGDNRTTS